MTHMQVFKNNIVVFKESEFNTLEVRVVARRFTDHPRHGAQDGFGME